MWYSGSKPIFISLFNYFEMEINAVSKRIEAILAEESLLDFNKELKEISENLDQHIKKLKAEFSAANESKEDSTPEETLTGAVSPEKEFTIPAEIIELKALIKTYKEKYTAEKQLKDQEEKNNLDTKKKILQEYRDLIQNEENLGRAFERIKVIRENWRAVGPLPRKHQQEIQNEYSKLSETFNYNISIYKELKEHDLKKNFSLKNQIVHEVEALKKEKNVKTLEKELTRLRDEWDEIGGTYKDKWEIIKEKYWSSVRDIYDLINAHYEDQRKIQAENLLKKQALLERLKPIASSQPENLKSWKSTTDKILNFQKEWKTIGFSSKKETKVVWEEFRAACNDFFDRKKAFFSVKMADANKNKEAKLNLISKANEVKLSKDWKEASHQLILLQKDWKKIGHAGPKDENKLWKQFRTACDEFFNAKNAHYTELETEFENNVKKKEDYIKTIEKLDFPSDPKELLNRIREIGTEFSEIGSVPKAHSGRINSAYNKALQSKINELPLSDDDKPGILFKAKVLGMKDAGDTRALDDLKSKLKKELNKLNDEITKAENNMGFFNISKGSEGLLADVNNRITKQKEEVEVLKKQIKTINLASK